jgi:predicted nucleotidyltransferase component of viral defense system
MKAYSERHIHRSELLQLILLQHLCGAPESSRLIFQGGTALRWCHNSGRFSEDLDFVTAIEKATLDRMLKSIQPALEREAIAHFGPGRLVITPRGQRDEGMIWRVAFEPRNSREKIMVKVECESLAKGATLDTEPRVLGMQSAVSYLIARGEFRIPRPNAVMVVETLEEILSDKVRALLERPYLKGRDIYDIWYLRQGLNAPLNQAVVERKFFSYTAVFNARRSLQWFENADGDLKESIEKDLARFLPPEVMAACLSEEYRPFLGALKTLFRELQGSGWKLPS